MGRGCARVPLLLLLLLGLLLLGLLQAGPLPAAAAAGWVARAARDPPPADREPPSKEPCRIGGNASLHVETLRILTDIKLRYATTVLHSKIVNTGKTAQESELLFVLPEQAFISSFFLVVNGTKYKAFVKRKEEAEKEYQEAVESGLSAAQIVTSSREADVFVLSINVEPKKSISFNLTYEELLSRRRSLYDHVITLTPSQVVKDFRVRINIKETNNITRLTVSVPGNETHIFNSPSNQEKISSSTLSSALSQNTAKISFRPTCNLQQSLSNYSSNDISSRQIKVQYDVNRTLSGSEFLFGDGYFVHFFAPESVKPLPKHVIFVLDTSGSMWGRKFEQLKDAMTSILDSLRHEDYFSLIQFGTDINVWSPQSQDMVGLTRYNITHEVNAANIDKAKYYISTMNVSGGTYLDGAIRKALQLAAKQRHELEKHMTPDDLPLPILLVLSDGIPTTGEIRGNRILAAARALNTEIQASIFSLSIGDSANFLLLKKLSLQNHGFARKVYEGPDTALQLKYFFEEIASPLLTNINFIYTGGLVVRSSVTESQFHSYYEGTEIIVAGKLQQKNKNESAIVSENVGKISAISNSKQYIQEQKKHKIDSKEESDKLERLWAHLNIKQLLNQYLGENENITYKEEAESLAMKYGFVTPFTSLIVVKQSNKSLPLQLITKPTEDDMEKKPSWVFQNKIVPLHMNHPPNPATQSQVASSTHLPENSSAQSASASTEQTYLNISDLVWLDEHLDTVGQLVIPSNDTDHETVYAIEDLEIETWMGEMRERKSCLTPNNEEGSCQPLAKCVLKEFAEDYHIYLKYFCPLDRMAGVCCPRRIK